MKTSKNGIDLIKKFEGCELTAYRDAVGVLTIGYGHTGTDVKEGQKIDAKKATALLKKDLEKFESKVNRYDWKYHFNQNEFDALVSFAYNIGNVDGLTKSGKRSRGQIADSIVKYNKAGGKVLNGLVKRRKAEQTLFLTPIR